MHAPTPTPPAVRGRTALIVASTGGHLAQAVQWLDRLELSRDSTFVTFDNKQSRSLLLDFNTLYVPYVSSRDYRGVARVARLLLDSTQARTCDIILSTGAGVALSCLAPALLFRKRFHYIESVSRFSGPSTTGKVLSALPTVQKYTQHHRWASRRWVFAGSLLDQYKVVSQLQHRGSRPLRILVTLGTIRPYRFDALVDAVSAQLRPEDEVKWQLGATTRLGLFGDCHTEMPEPEFDQALRWADVVITHAGVGGILKMLGLGISPVVVPRCSSRGEHIDDHQDQVASALSDLGVVTRVQPSGITRALLETPRGRVISGRPPV